MTTDIRNEGKVVINNNGVETVREPTNDEQTLFRGNPLQSALNQLRAKRDALLKETDYLALSDNTLTDEMTTYRQALRDITNGLTTVEDVEAVTWPTKP